MSLGLCQLAKNDQVKKDLKCLPTLLRLLLTVKQKSKPELRPPMFQEKKGTQSSLKSSLERVDPKVRDVFAARGQGFQPLHGLSSISANVQLSPCFCFMETKIPLCKALTWELEDT